MRPRSKPSNFLKIGFIFEQVLDEIFNSITKTEYSIIKEHGFDIYRFKTNNGNSYDLEIHFGGIPIDTKLNNNKTIGDYYAGHEGFANSIDLGFTPTEVEEKNRDKPEEYNKETNRGEHIDLMGRISFLIKEIIKNRLDFNVFVIGHDTENTKLMIYNKIFENSFKNYFEAIDGDSWFYKNGATYFIKKTK
jgi:hypothetical protein